MMTISYYPTYQSFLDNQPILIEHLYIVFIDPENGYVNYVRNNPPKVINSIKMTDIYAISVYEDISR